MAEDIIAAETPSLFKGVTEKELFGMVCGKFLGAGAFREVFEYLLDPTCVIKVEMHSATFENVLEWEIWQVVKDTEHAKWFAPCIRVSGQGTWMVQKKTKPLTEKQLPDKMPVFFTDIKRGNIGLYKGHPCVHDYGRNLIVQRGLSSRLKTIDWKNND